MRASVLLRRLLQGMSLAAETHTRTHQVVTGWRALCGRGTRRGDGGLPEST